MYRLPPEVPPVSFPRTGLSFIVDPLAPLSTRLSRTAHPQLAAVVTELVYTIYACPKVEYSAANGLTLIPPAPPAGNVLFISQ